MGQKSYNKRQNGAKTKKDNDVLGVTLIVVSLFLLICIAIPPILSVVSWGIFNVVLGVFGIAAYPALIALLLLGILLLLRHSLGAQPRTVVCIILLCFFALMILQLASTHDFLGGSFSEYIDNTYHAKYSAGGVIFGTLAFGLKSLITEVGCYIAFSLGVIVVVVIMTDLVGRIRASREPAPQPPAPIIPPAPRGFMSEGEAQRVVPIEPENKLYVGLIQPPRISVETGKASEIAEREKREVSDYSSSPVVDDRSDDMTTAEFMLYGAQAEIAEREREEFENRGRDREERDERARAGADSPARAKTAVEPVNREERREPSKAAPHASDTPRPDAAKPRKIDHTDTSPDMQIFFPANKNIEFNPSDDIISDVELSADLQADAKKLKQSDMDSAASDRYAPPQFLPDFSDRVSDLPRFEPIDDIFTAPPAKDSDIMRSDGFADFVEPAPAEPEQEDIIDAFDMRDMYADDDAPSIAPVQKPEQVIDDIITDASAFAREDAYESAPSPVEDEFDGDIIDGVIGEEPEPVKPTAMSGLTVDDGPAVDMSETRDVTSDLIDGTQRSGMYVAADDEAPVAPKPSAKKRNMPMDNQISIDDSLRRQADESVMISASAPRRKKYNYAPPPIELLKVYSKGDVSQDDLNKNAETLETVIGNFLKTDDVHVKRIVPGPTVTRYELELASGIPVKSIESRAQDIEYELATSSQVRIEAPIPGKRAIGIEVPNNQRDIVGLREVIESHEFNKAKSAMTFIVGKDISGGIVLCDLEKVPHLLIAGQTGSGKSACLNGLLVSLLYKSSPEDLRFILVDPKHVEFSAYAGMPHLLFDRIIYEPSEVLSALKWASEEMERRYSLMSKYGRNNIGSFNSLNDVTSGKIDKLSHIIIIIDELADIMQSAHKRDIEDRIKVIAAKARAAGIHLIVATQRPSADVITGTIKANLTSRIAFRVNSQIDSRIILDTAGAETLTGKGDMLFFPVEFASALRVQGAFISDEEVVSVISYVREHYDCDFDEDAFRAVFEAGPAGIAGASGGDAAKEDPLFLPVLALCIKSGQVSTSGIQRRFSIGYARAARILDMFEQLGYISPATGNNKPREVLMTAEEFKAEFGKDVDDFAS